jgi:Glycosyltransferase like family 2
MSGFLLALATVALAGWLGVAWLAWRADRALPDLHDLPPDPAPPAVSVVVPCRDEARDVEATVRSLLAQELPALQVVAVDDRSSDATGAILDQLAASDPRLTVVHVTALPAGWLGKNHALEVGGRRARGEWLLFTDGDVLFRPGALRRALGYARAHRLGHLAAAPRFIAPGFLERAFVTGFGAFASLAFRVHRLGVARSSAFVGIGAFNLVRRADWERIGGHERLRLEVVDDVKLGLVLRRSGVAQGAVSGGGLVAVRWQHGFWPSVLGLVKNAFAGTEYRPGLAVLASLALALAGLGPLLVALAALANRQWLAAALASGALLVGVVIHGGAARRLAGGSGLEGLALPLASSLLAGVLLGSTAAALWRGGVVWRGTRYPLAELRRGCVRTEDWPRQAAAGWPE